MRQAGLVSGPMTLLGRGAVGEPHGRTGDVVHVHRCVGDARFVEDEVHQRTAMRMAGGTGEGQELRVLPVPPDLELRGTVSLHVDVGTGRIVARQEEPKSLKDLKDEDRKRKGKSPARKAPARRS
jgi:hypothetical protein